MIKRFACALLILTCLSAPSKGDDGDWTFQLPDDNPIVVVLNESSRQYRNTGTIILRDPEYGVTLGSYAFATGGRGRGSAPFGAYVIGAFRSDGPIGPRWMLREVGREDGEVWDQKLNDMRTWIELHKSHTGYSLGCLAVRGDWHEFMRYMRYILAVNGETYFVMIGNPAVEPILAYSQPKRQYKHRQYKYRQYKKRRHRR